MNKTYESAIKLYDFGFCVIPLEHGKKRPLHNAWQSTRLTRDGLESEFNRELVNIGIVLGEPSGYLVSVDLDCAEAVELAETFLPPTNAIIGRDGKRRSHYLYYVNVELPTKRFRDPSDGTMIVECLGSGAQVMAPGSTHPSGELIRWERDGEPARVDAEDLLSAIRVLHQEILARRRRAIEQRGSELMQPDVIGAGTQPPPDSSTDSHTRLRALKYLDCCDSAVSGFGGHNALLHAASSLVHGFALPEQEAYQLLKEHYNPRCIPPWSDNELRHKVNEAARIAHEEPRGHLLRSSQHDINSLVSAQGTDITPSAMHANGSSLKIRSFSEIEPATIEWIWEGVAARKMLTLFAGDPGMGKSIATCDFAARVSTGRDFPTGIQNPHGPRRVLMLNCEDDPGHTIRGRLEAAGADLSLIGFIDGAQIKGSEEGFRLDSPTHIALLDKWLNEHDDTDILFIDPVTAFSGKTDNDRATDVRQLLRPIQELASRHNISVVLVTHLNKGATKAAYRVNGSNAWMQVPRLGWGFDQDCQDQDRRIMAPLKSNVSSDRDGFAFRIEQGKSSGVRVVWEDRVATTDRNALFNSFPPNMISEREAYARDFIREALADGPVAAEEITASANSAGISSSTLNRAKKRMGAVTKKVGFDGGWVWSLPSSDLAGETEGSSTDALQQSESYEHEGRE